MKFNLLKKTHYRIIFLISVLTIFMVSVVYYSHKASSENVKLLVKEEETESTLLLAKVIKSKTNEISTFAKDYTYWDEMVSFTETHDTLWASRNLKVSLDTYNADYVWVFGKNYDLFYFTSAEGFNVADTAIISAEMLKILEREGSFFHFFVNTIYGLIEISGATIHPTADPQRHTMPRGYFAAGRLWDENMLSDIAEYTGSAITIKEISTGKEQEADNKKPLHIKSEYTLFTWDKEPIAKIVSIENEPLAEAINRELELQFGIMLGFVVLFLGFVSASLYFFVNKPVRKISASLKENNTAYLSGMMNYKDEFGEMSRLVNEFFSQKELLLKEISERIEVEDRARETEIELRHSLNEKVILLKEVHHRVKNNLQVIISLIRLQADTLGNKASAAHLNSILSRIRSIAFVHELLYRSQDLGRIDFEEYIRKFTISLIDMYGGSSQRIELKIDVKDILIGVDLAVPCGIIINELVTNSMKHAFNDNSKGTISIAMKSENGKYILTVSDSGTSDPENLKLKNPASLGMYLVTSLAEQLEAELDIKAGKNTTFTFKFPDV